MPIVTHSSFLLMESQQMTSKTRKMSNPNSHSPLAKISGGRYNAGQIWGHQDGPGDDAVCGAAAHIYAAGVWSRRIAYHSPYSFPGPADGLYVQK